MEPKLLYIIIIDEFDFWEEGKWDKDAFANNIRHTLIHYFPRLRWTEYGPYGQFYNAEYTYRFDDVEYIFIYDNEECALGEEGYTFKQDAHTIRDNPTVIKLSELKKTDNLDVGDIIDKYYGDSLNENEDDIVNYYKGLLNQSPLLPIDDELYKLDPGTPIKLLPDLNDHYGRDILDNFGDGDGFISCEYICRSESVTNQFLIKLGDGSGGWYCRYDADYRKLYPNPDETNQNKCWLINTGWVIGYQFQ